MFSFLFSKYPGVIVLGHRATFLTLQETAKLFVKMYHFPSHLQSMQVSTASHPCGHSFFLSVGDRVTVILHVRGTHQSWTQALIHVWGVRLSSHIASPQKNEDRSITWPGSWWLWLQLKQPLDSRCDKAVQVSELQMACLASPHPFSPPVAGLWPQTPAQAASPAS